MFPDGNMSSLDIHQSLFVWGRHARDCMVVGFTTTCAISAYYR